MELLARKMELVSVCVFIYGDYTCVLFVRGNSRKNRLLLN